MAEPMKQVDQAWQPPTPTSSQIAYHSPNLPVDHLVLLPPPLVPTSDNDNRRRTASDQDQVNRFYPSQLLPPLQIPSKATTTSHAQNQARHHSPPTMSWEEEYTKPPRRSAAIAAARNIPRNPSPLELDSDDTSFSPPPLVVPSSTAASTGGGGGAASKRKVSHSLIERRRREKINDCLATLKETVPSLKEEGEKKIAKAKERGRKRGRGDEAGERGGLHKLEILQGTIEYIATLRARVEQLEATMTKEERPRDFSSPSNPASSASSHNSSCSSTIISTRPSSLVTNNSFDSSTTAENPDSSPIMSREEADHAANMLLYFSTSPELRPVLV